MITSAVLRAVGFVALALLAALPAVAAPEVTVLADGRRLVIVRPEGSAPKGVVLLVPGGTTTLTLGPGGETKNGNFVIRTRGLLLNAGFAIAYMNDPADLRAPIALLRTVARPVVVLGTSRGTILAAQSAAKLGADGPDMLVMATANTTGTGTPEELTHVATRSLADVDMRALKLPTLIVTNDGDTCNVSPPGGAVALAKRIGANATLIHVSSTAITGAPCDAFAPHGYFGIENEVIAKIGDWIARQLRLN